LTLPQASGALSRRRGGGCRRILAAALPASEGRPAARLPMTATWSCRQLRRPAGTQRPSRHGPRLVPGNVNEGRPRLDARAPGRNVSSLSKRVPEACQDRCGAYGNTERDRAGEDDRETEQFIPEMGSARRVGRRPVRGELALELGHLCRELVALDREPRVLLQKFVGARRFRFGHGSTPPAAVALQPRSGPRRGFGVMAARDHEAGDEPTGSRAFVLSWRASGSGTGRRRGSRWRASRPSGGPRP
jgi:hypothetical protein